MTASAVPHPELQGAPPAPAAIQPVDPLTFTDDMPEFPPAVIAVLATPTPEDLVEVREPNDLLYVPWIHYQNILVKAFGVAGFRLVPRSVPRTEGNQVTWLGALFVRIPGTTKFHFIDEAKGECNAKLGAGNAVEGAKSDCLTKCCKRLNIFMELFDPRWRRAWESKYKAKHIAAKAQRAWPAARSAPANTAAAPAASSPAATAGQAGSSAEPAAGPASTPASSPPATDTGEAASAEQLDAIKARVKVLAWKVGFLRQWFARHFGITAQEPARILGALTAQQADTAMALLLAHGTGAYDALLAASAAKGLVRK